MSPVTTTASGRSRAEKAARVISWITHPLLMPLAAVALLLYGGTYLAFLSPPVKHFVLTLVFLNTLLIPLAYMHVFRRLGIIGSYYLEQRRERYLPIALYILLLLITRIILRRVQQPVILTDLFLALTVTAALTFLVTLRWKVSLHLAAWGSLSALLLAVSFRLTHTFTLWWLLSLPAAGLTATARLLLRQHTPDEVYAGFFVAFATTFLVMMV